MSATVLHRSKSLKISFCFRRVDKLTMFLDTQGLSEVTTTSCHLSKKFLNKDKIECVNKDKLPTKRLFHTAVTPLPCRGHDDAPNAVLTHLSPATTPLPRPSHAAATPLTPFPRSNDAPPTPLPRSCDAPPTQRSGRDDVAPVLSRC